MQRTTVSLRGEFFMRKGIILYQSKYGATKRYANVVAGRNGI